MRPTAPVAPTSANVSYTVIRVSKRDDQNKKHGALSDPVKSESTNASAVDLACQIIAIF